MKTNITIIILFLTIASKSFSQGGWFKITDPLNAVSQYTTIFPYVGAAFIDFNNDNLPDLFAAPRTVFVNQGNGRYSLGSPLNFTILNATSGSSWADLDNDGDNDCVLAATPSRVFLNTGSGVFTNATPFFPGLQNYGSFGCAIGDLNEDRYPEIVYAHAEGFHPGSISEPCRFYVPADTSFGLYQTITGYPFTQQLSSYTNPYWSDYDMDGDMDLFIASGPANGTPALDPCYRNMKIETGFDTLFKMTTELFAQQTQDGQCYNFIDYDNDGDFDLCLTNYYSAPTRLYQNNNGVYVEVNTPFSSATPNLANCWGDYDNDGDLDVIITNNNFPTRYYRNDAGIFTYLSNGFSTPTAANGVTNGDYDNDGDLDLFINGVAGFGNTTSVGLYKNDTVAGSRKWVNINLEGTISNKSAIGSIVKVKSLINGLTVWQTREVNAQNSFQGQNDLRVHFGLGNSAIIDSIIIKWSKGLTESFSNINVKKFYKAVEDSGLSEITVGITQISSTIPERFALSQNYPNPFNPTTKIKFSIPSETGLKSVFAKLTIFNSLGKEIETLLSNELTAGTYEVDWNASSYPSGVYFYKLSYGSYADTKRMLFVK